MAPLFIVAKKDGTPGSFRLDRFQTRKGFDNNFCVLCPSMKLNFFGVFHIVAQHIGQRVHRPLEFFFRIVNASDFEQKNVGR